MNILTFRITGFTCQACVILARRRIETIDGIEEISLNDTGETCIKSLRKISLNEIRDVLADTKYQIQA